MNTSDNNDALALSPELIAEALELASIRRTARSLAERESALRDRLRDALGDAGVEIGLGADGLPLVVVTKSIRRNVSGKTLEALFPKVYAEVATTSQTEQVRVTVPTATPKV